MGRSALERVRGERFRETVLLPRKIMNPIFSLPLLLLPASAVLPLAGPATTTNARALESVAELVAAGRALLAEGHAADAQVKFEAAVKLDGSIAVRQWLLRSWIAQGRVNDALNEIDGLAKTERGSALDYLYGMAFAQKAKGYIAEGVSGGIIGMAFGDAVEFLKKATNAEPVLYGDAFGPLAESAWYAQDLETARAAAEKAVALDAKSADSWALLGRIAFSQYQGFQSDPTRVPDADKSWTAAHDAFTKAHELYAASTEPSARTKGAESSTQIGWLYVWKKQTGEGAKRFAAAIAIDPSATDYGQLRGSLGDEAFVTCLEDAAKQYETSNGKETTGDATLLWWLGFARYAAKQYEGAEAAFTRAVAKAPDFANSWYYVALARYFRQDYDGAIAGFRTHYGISKEDAAASLRANQDENLRILDYMVGMKAGKAANLDAAFLSELQTLMAPDVHRYWNNLGLFLRDEGEARERRNRDVTAEQHKEIQDLYERSYVAYLKSLELSPDDPNYLNDAALMLHYHFDRDLDQARAWYVKAAEMAENELARKDLDKEVRPLREMALRDAKNNLRDLDKIIEAKKKAKEGAGTPPQ